MEIEGTTFGTITIDGKNYEHDVIIRLSGLVVARHRPAKSSRTIPASTASPLGAGQIDRCSSNANSLHGQNLAGLQGIRASFQRDNLRRHF
jgi:hypothetical protein